MSDSDFENHAKFTKAHNITNGSPYTNILTRFSFNNPKNHNLDTSVLDIKPDRSNLNSGYASGFASKTAHPFNYSYH